MLFIMVASVILVAMGALATFLIADMLDEGALSKVQQHGRYGYLGEEETSAAGTRAGLQGGLVPVPVRARRHAGLVRVAARRRVAYRGAHRI
jgi:hypothetical protein